MPRKPKKGYFVSGRFVAEGSELDLEYQRERKGGDAPSRTERKRESTALQQLGEDLLALRAEPMDRLALPDRLVEALEAARRISNFEGKRRQLQFVGKLMRQLDADTLDAVRTVLSEQQRGSAGAALALHQVEQWRDRLVADEAALSDWVRHYPRSDSQQVRALARQARRDAKPTVAGETPRHGKAYRALFQLIRAQLHDPQDHDQEPQHHGSIRHDL